MISGSPLSVPGDKSLTHRALFLAALARGRSRLGNLLTAFDARSSARVLRQLGIGVTPVRSRRTVTVEGQGRLRQSESTLHCGNSGTAVRLLLGLLAGHSFPARLTGDRSLRRRPMRRVTDPLARMGASFTLPQHDGLPLTVHGGSLRSVEYRMPVPSAQVKSAVILAGLAGGVPVAVMEPRGRSRDHTERLLRSFGFSVQESGEWIRFKPDGRIEPFEFRIPGDPSSAAFLVGAALLARRGTLILEEVGINPTRTGFLEVLRRMGARLQVETVEERLGEPVGILEVSVSPLQATTVAAKEIPSLIDEIPMLAVLAARAEGTTVFDEVGELRVKESDRLGLLARNLQLLGVEARAEQNRLYVTGTNKPLRGRVVTDGDHRLAMAFGVLGQSQGVELEVDDPDCAGVSYPNFWQQLASLNLE